MREFAGFRRGMGIGGWLTNYKRFHVLPEEWRLRLSPGDYEHFESYITRRDVDYIASLGLDHVRLGFDQLVLEEAPGRCRERIWRIIDRFIGWCGDAGLNVVLNLHKAVGNYCDIQEELSLMDSPELQERFVAMWMAVEERCGHHPGIAFELLNEVRNIPPEQWNLLARKAIGALRSANPARRIIVGGINWNSGDALRHLSGFDDDIIFTWHFYTPFEFTHQQGVLQAGPLYYNRQMAYPGAIEPYNEFYEFVYGERDHYRGYERIDKDFLRREMAPAFEFAAEHPERIVWCGEFGTIRHCPLEYRENYMSDVISLLLEHGMSYCAWNYLSTPNDGNRFSLVDDDHRRILSRRLAEIISGEA